MGGDVFMNPPVRYIGYSFAFWEAMQTVLRTKPEKTFYTVGAIFIVLHAVHHAVEANGAQNMVWACIDSLIFDAIASVLVPVCVAKAVFEVTSHLLIDLNIHYHVTRYGPPFLALLAILVMSCHLDTFTHKAMDKTVRQLYSRGLF